MSCKGMHRANAQSEAGKYSITAQAMKEYKLALNALEHY